MSTPPKHVLSAGRRWWSPHVRQSLIIGVSRCPRWAGMAAGMGSLLAVYACWQVFRWTPGHRALAGDIFFYPFVAAAAWAAWRASKRCADSPRLRSAWRLLALAFVASCGGEIAQTVYEALHQKPFPSAADVFFLSFYPLMLWGLLRFAVGRRSFSERLRLGLDLAVVALGGSALVLYLVLGPTVVAGSPDLVQGIFSIAYPVGDMVLLVGLASVLVREADPSARRALGFFAIGLLLYVLGDVIYGYISLHSTYHGGDPVDSFWVVAIAVWAVAGAAQNAPGARSEEILEVRPARASRAPYIASALGFTVLIVVLRHRPFFPDVSLAITAALIAALVSARQFLAQRDLMITQRVASYQALHDVLTGLPNRRSLIDDLTAALASAGHDRPRTLAMFDLDGFKAYNDTFGHLAGDRLLDRLGQRLDSFVAGHGRAYRLGGDEFCVLLDAMGAPPAEIVAGAADALSETGSGFSIGASYGMVAFPNEADDVSAVLHMADTRMYTKKNGRRAATIISQTRDVLLRASDEHSHDLHEHMLEVGELSRNVARRLDLDAETIELTLRTGELHDIGQIAIPQSILSSPRPLSDDEWAFIRSHTLIGERVLNAAPALQPVASLVRSTHERYDGAGYPDGLRGERIPLPSRIVFACGSFHAMITRRPYSPEMSEAKARAELRSGAGSQFDPHVVDALLAELDQRTLTQSPTETERPAQAPSVAAEVVLTGMRQAASQVSLAGELPEHVVVGRRRGSAWMRHRAGRCLMLVVLAAFVGSLVLGPGDGYHAWRDGWLATIAFTLPALMCLASARRRGPGRAGSVLLGLGMLCYAAGNAIYVFHIQFLAPVPFPSWSDAGDLAFYPCAFVALALSRPRDARGVVALDGALGAGAAAAVLAAVLSPVFAGVSGQGAAFFTAVAYPVFDLFLIAIVAGMLAARGARAGGPLLWMGAGLLIFVVADVVYALRVSAGTYVVGTPLDCLWAIGVTVIAFSAWANPTERPSKRASLTGALVVPLVSSLVAVVVLVIASQYPVSSVAVAVAAMTLLIAVARTAVSLRQVVQLSDMRAQARTDDLTGLPNRRAFHERINGVLSARGELPRLAMLVIDLDGFKEINDSFGHSAGDEVLMLIGAALTQQIRADDMVARTGGDEFGVLLANTTGGDPTEIAERLLAALRSPIELAGMSVHIDASIGIALCPEHATDADALFRHADIAMYHAKAAHAGSEMYRPEIDRDGRHRLELLEALRAGIDRDELVVHYQPKIDLRSGTVVGVEALVRWEHPTRGLLFPDAFIALAEQSGLMRRITLVVLEQALRQTRAWREQGLDLSIAVNLSASNLLDTELPAQVGLLLESIGVKPSTLQLEITESVLMTDPARARRVLDDLHGLGVEISVDDYGTGYSSLTYLQDLPVDELKLDRSFVTQSDISPRSAAIVASTVALAHSLEMRIVAEGVETEAVHDLLRSTGCDQLQGFLICRPLPARRFIAWLDTHATMRPKAIGPLAE